MELGTEFETLNSFVTKILFTLKGFAYDLYDWLLAGFEFDWRGTHYSVTGLDIIGAIAITWFTARIISTLIDISIPN